MEWLPKPRTYGGENEYSIWPHKPDSVGATPTPATKKPDHDSVWFIVRMLACGEKLCGGSFRY